jgi:hypothetical protein
VFERPHFSQATTVAGRIAEVSGQESFNQFPSERGTDNFPPQTKDIHVVVFDALTGGEDIMDEPGADTGNPGVRLPH